MISKKFWRSNLDGYSRIFRTSDSLAQLSGILFFSRFFDEPSCENCRCEQMVHDKCLRSLLDRLQTQTCVTTRGRLNFIRLEPVKSYRTRKTLRVSVAFTRPWTVHSHSLPSTSRCREGET
jgi:hypothetical protein